MLVMVIERFKDGRAGEVYHRLRKQGRLLPEGVQYIDSWVDTGFSRCFQLMECPELSSLEEWTRSWNDLVDFEFVQVHTGTEAFAIAADWESVKHLQQTSPFKPRQWLRRHGVATEHIIQSDESWYEAAISMPGEPSRLIGGAPSRAGAELIVSRQLAALEHVRCTDQCDREWRLSPGEGG
jgi:hypothetical protein